MTEPKEGGAGRAAAGQRLVSVDALRGFDMFWITCVGGLVDALGRLFPKSAAVAILATQLRHARWEGFRFEDLIFPLFVFIVGVSTVFSLDKALERDGLKAALIRIARRGLVLYLLGVFNYGGFANAWPGIRLSGVLQHIAVAYVGTGVLYCLLRKRIAFLAGACAGLLLGYWALMTFIPIRDIQMTPENLTELAAQSGDARSAEQFRKRENWSAVKDSPAWAAAEKMFYAATNRIAGAYDMGRNVSDHFDFQYLPGRKWDTFFDPQGYLQAIPTTASCLLGLLAGLLLRSHTLGDRRKVVVLLAAGAVLLGLGLWWGQSFPVIKRIWTSSYVLVAGGCSALLMGLFYLVVDVWKLRLWCRPFVWLGANAITIYVLVDGGLFSFTRVAQRLAGGDIRQFFETQVGTGSGDLVIVLLSMALTFLFLRFLYKRQIFLRV